MSFPYYSRRGRGGGVLPYTSNNQRLESAFNVTRLSLSFAKLVMMSFTPAKSAGDARYASQDPFIQSTLPHTIPTPICIRNAFFLRRTQ